MELSTAVEQGDLVKTKSLLESRSGDDMADLINSPDPSGMTLLHTASQKGHPDLVKYLLDLGAEVRKLSREEYTALYYASCNGHLDVVKCLVENGSELEMGRDTPLYVASRENHLGVVKYLVSEGANVNRESNNGALPLCIASNEGHLSIVTYLLENGANLDMCNINGISPLYAASINGHLSVVQSLANAGAGVDQTTNIGDTPIHAASRRGHVDIVKELANAGADVNKTLHGETPIHAASRQGHTDIVKFLNAERAVDAVTGPKTPIYVASHAGNLPSVVAMVNAGDDVNIGTENGETPLLAASSEGHDDIVECLVNARADVNKASKDGDTPLFAAIREGHIDIAKYLISKGADLDMTHSAGRTPLHIASHKAHLGVVKYLVNAGADVNRTTNYGDPPLFAAIRENHIDIMEYLITKGADPDTTGGAGRTPLYIASQKGHLGVVESLVNAGADVNKVSKDDDPPLFAAIRENHIDIMEYLITKGADPDMTGDAGRTPLYIASQKGHLGVVESLVNTGADVNKAANDGNTPLLAASSNGHVDIVKYLISKGTTLDFANKDGDTSFSLALKEGHLGIAEYLVIAGADVNKVPIVRCASLHAASGHGYINVVKYLIRISSGVNVRDEFGFTPLHYAAQNGHLGIVECLVNSGADANTRSHENYLYPFSAQHAEVERIITGITPLHLASQAGHLRIVEYLVQTGADVNEASSSVDSSWETHHFGNYGWPTESERTKTGNIKSITPLHLASQAGHLRIVECLAQAGANVNQASVDGVTPLHAALNACLLDKSYPRNIRGRDVGMIKYVIDISSIHAALPEKQYGIGEPFAHFERDVEKASRTTQLHTSSNESYLDIARYLVMKGAEVDKSNGVGVTPLQLASLAGHLGAVECLVNTGADVNKAAKHDDMSSNLPPPILAYLQLRRRRYPTLGPEDDYAHKLPIYIASEEGHLDIVQYLLKSRADVNLAKENGDTPLHAASNEGHFDVVKYLNTRGANILACNKDGITPLHAASLKGNLKIVEYLVEAGANVNTVSSLGEGPLQAASRMGYHGVAQYLSEVCKNRSTPAGQGGLQRSPAHSVFDPAILDVPTYGPTTSSGKEQMAKPLGEASRARISTSLDSASDLDKEDDQYHSRSPDAQPTTEGRDIINLEEYHILAKIPAGEQGVNDITIEVIEKAPSDLVLKEDEAIIAVGLKLSPSGLQFSTPLRITIPHSAIFTSPEKANISFYTRANDGDIFSGVSPSANGTPRCVVRQDDLDLYIDHFSEWWIITYLRETFIGKRLMCTPYVPLLRPKNVTHCIVMVLRDDVRGTPESIPDYKAALPGTQFLVRWRYGKLGVTYRVDNKEISHESMEEREFYYLNNHRMYFQLEPVDADTLQVMVEFILKQDITKKMMFPLLTQDVILSRLPSHMPSVPCNPESIRRTHSSDHPLASQLVSGKQAIQPHDKYPDKERMKEPIGGEDHGVRTMKKDPGARPKTRKNGDNFIQSQPGSSTRISSYVSSDSAVDSTEGEVFPTRAEMLTVLQSSSVRDDRITTSSTQKERNYQPPQACPEIIDELDSTASELDRMKLVHVEQASSPPPASLPAATAREQIGAMALEESLPNILQMVGAGRMQERTTNVAIYVDKRTINQPLGHGENAGNRSHIPVPSVVPVKLLHVLGVKLNKESPILEDWKGLAVELGLDEYIPSLEQRVNPTEELISLAESRQTIQNLEDLAEAFQRMKRADCEELCRSYALDFERTCPPDVRKDDDSDSF